MSVSATRTERATSELLEYVSEAVAAAGVLRTAVRLGVLDQLDAGVATAPELAAACDIGEPGAERLLSALGGLGLLELHGGRWRRRLAEFLAGALGRDVGSP